MAIIQISKIQQRSGNLVDLPQLDDAQFGWASDEKKLFIGKTLPNENIEVLTSYSNIEFSQLVGSEGNLNITAAANGEVLSYDGTNWVNKGATAGGLINLGNVGNVKIGGGATGYVLETDGTGNLAWTPKATIIAYISNVTKANPAVVTTVVPNFLSDSAKITITDVGGMTQLNGNSYYIDILTSSTFALYTDAALTIPVDSTAYGTYTTGGRIVSTPGASGGSTAGGANTTIQFNNNNLLDGDPDFTYDYNTNLLSLTGNANVGNLNATSSVTASRLISNIATGTAPFTVTSTTQVANLNVATAGLATYATTANSVAGGNVSGAVGLATYATTANAVAGANVSGEVAYATTANSVAGANVSGTVANATYATSAGTVTTNAQPNITSVGNLSSLTVNNGTYGNVVINQFGSMYASGFGSNPYSIIQIKSNDTTTGMGMLAYTGLNGQIYSNSGITFTTGVTIRDQDYPTGGTTRATIDATGLSVTGNITSTNANLGNLATASYFTGTLTTAAQPNITSTGTLTSLTVSANVAADGIKTDNYYYANGVSISFAGSYSNSNVASYLPTFTGTVGAGTATHYGTTLTTGSSATAGTITGAWTLSSGSTLNATYADLAEYYQADQNYDPATVLEFGGDNEVTLASDGTARVAGVVSTNPAYAMNANCQGIAVAIALQGRVPTKVRGVVRKGDMMVSAGDGYARPSLSPQMGTVIGKALENFDGVEGVIEIAVGRL